METTDMIKVMQHFANGGEIEYIVKNDEYTSWSKCVEPLWDWFDYEYRIKQQTITMEKWLMRRSDEYYICTTNKISNYSLSTPVKLLETYEIEI